MSENRKHLGKRGEDLAVSYLKKAHGYHILQRNYRCVFGEVDIIARDHGVLSFIEVRTRGSEDFGDPKDSINKRKQQQLSKVALEFISRYNVHQVKARFDVVAVYLLTDQGCLRISPSLV
jgi:putative endonuclease